MAVGGGRWTLDAGRWTLDAGGSYLPQGGREAEGRGLRFLVSGFLSLLAWWLVSEWAALV